MNTLEKLLYALVGIIGTVYVVTAILAFFGIGFETYGVYLMFTIAMMIFAALLPEHQTSVFTEIAQNTGIVA
jgi:hypothetical protein